MTFYKDKHLEIAKSPFPAGIARFHTIHGHYIHQFDSCMYVPIIHTYIDTLRRGKEQSTLAEKVPIPTLSTVGSYTTLAPGNQTQS